MQRQGLRGGRRSLLSPVVIGAGIWLGFPAATAYQDMASLVSGIEDSQARWGAVVEKAVAGSVHAAEMAFTDASLKSGTLSGAGLVTPGIGAVAFRGKAAVSDIPDELRVNRADKRGRIVIIAPAAPPKSFNAGTVFERTSLLVRPAKGAGFQMAFVQPDIKGREVQIAGAFYPIRTPKPAAGVPAMLASLVTGEKADILATAYAPPEPDYARASPFASLLKGEDPNHGRFVPPLQKGDHGWMHKPLPPHVFTKAEQKCLATGIYFEARGENLRGQAAVAQVILNRVRNPTYPNTICGVVYQNQNLKNRCQFSFACDGIKDRISSPRNYKIAEDIAMAVTAGKIFIPEVGSSTHYHATYVAPSWSNTMKKMKKIGLHIFYRTYGGGWS
jgi:spore germination cell wall hydrolase CwlJ-like protein